MFSGFTYSICMDLIVLCDGKLSKVLAVQTEGTTQQDIYMTFGAVRIH